MLLLTTHAAIILLSWLASKGSSSAIDYRYEACSRVPKSCGSGPNVSYPFYISGLQESYCGHPGFALNCSQDYGLPILNLSGNDYVVKDIYYTNSSTRVFDASVPPSSSPEINRCRRILENTTIPTSLFTYAARNANITKVYLFSSCSALSEKFDPSTYIVPCSLSRGSNNSGYEDTKWWIIAVHDKDKNLKEAQDKCDISAVKPVEHLERFLLRNGTYNVNVSTLLLTLRSGIGLSWKADSDCKSCKASGGYCGFDSEVNRFSCFCKDGPHFPTCYTNEGMFQTSPDFYGYNSYSSANHSGGNTGGTIAIISGTAVVVVVLVTFIIILFLRKKRKRRRSHLARNNMELFLKNHGDVAPKRYKYSQMKKMTRKFKDNLGKGGYGSVYKGKLDDGRLVAVKILDHTKGNGDDFLNEVACISRTSHVNIVSLLGFCLEDSRRALVYEYMPNGSLDKFIQDSSSLNWERLCDIALGIARGLEYLHQGCSTRILHFDIKPHNVLLDKDMRPKISDFGLAKLCPDRVSIVSMSGTRGTIGYIAPELFNRFFGTVSYKSDVYSYGMMVLEMVGERVNNNGRRRERNDCTSSSDMYFPNWIYTNLEMNFEDDEIDDDECRLVKRKLTIVGLWCIQNDSKDRPSMTKVVEMLEGDVKLLQVPPKPYLSSPTREVQDVWTSASGVTSAFDENII